MNVIFGRKNAEDLKERHLILELETFDAGGKSLECFCIVPGESIPVGELTSIQQYSKIHQTLVDNLNKKNYTVCQELIGHLYGRFGGELDSFYQVILDRITAST